MIFTSIPPQFWRTKCVIIVDLDGDVIYLLILFASMNFPEIPSEEHEVRYFHSLYI